MKSALLILLFLLGACSSKPCQSPSYPKHWWAPIRGEKKPWEIAPDSVKPAQVILSKRNELGLLSNFAPTPFVYRGKRYASMEGFWQAMKYPEDSKDPRNKMAKWPYMRAEVEQMTSFQAKKAGDFGSKVMKHNKLNWVSFENKRMLYREPVQGPFYDLIKKAMGAKLEQNPEVERVLCQTQGLELLPDHSQGKNPPPAWRYHQIWMDLRESFCKL
jgi:predicted NAD-dependent protein-ADP-ribosyltransferase YbiA (DUF1768 family)